MAKQYQENIRPALIIVAVKKGSAYICNALTSSPHDYLTTQPITIIGLSAEDMFYDSENERIKQLVEYVKKEQKAQLRYWYNVMMQHIPSLFFFNYVYDKKRSK
ncbi:MAG: hypothetical protein GXN99_03100 [Candidatus Nanohaloarchaeota archaeon]|nr:hypothetical protein [Candidatus Nanohaloarchaeota archaeon]